MPDRRKLIPVVILALWTIGNGAWTLAMRSHRGPERVAAASDHGAEHAAAADSATAAHMPPDTRQVLAVPAEARDAVLAEMRVMLGALEGALHAAAQGDTAALRRAVTPAGVAMAADHSLEALLPPQWMRLAMATHQAFDSLPGVAASPTARLAALGRITQGCNSCHAMYRLEAR